jgi:hypothetical protein
VSGGSEVLALVSGLPAPERNEQLLLMFQIYVDESISTQPPIYVLAGHISTAEKWARFSDEWKQRLDMTPRLEYFKMSEAMGSPSGQFAGFSDESVNEKLRMLDSLIQEYATGSIACTLNQEEYAQIFGSPRVPKEMRSPYYFLAFEMMRGLAKFQSHFAIDKPIDFIFDEQVGQAEKIVSAWNDFKAQSPFGANLGSATIFRDEKRFLPLQAADMLAWFVRRRHEEHIAGLPRIELPLYRGRKEVPMLAFPWTSKMLKEMFCDIVEGPRLRFTFGPWRYVVPLVPREY